MTLWQLWGGGPLSGSELLGRKIFQLPLSKVTELAARFLHAGRGHRPSVTSTQIEYSSCASP